MKKKGFVLVAILALLSLGACSKNNQDLPPTKAPDVTETPMESPKPSKTPISEEVEVTGVYTNLVDKAEQEEIKTIMQEVNLSNIDTFFKWVNAFNHPMKEDAGLASTWQDVRKKNYNYDKLNEYWETSTQFETDLNSRLTSYLLLQGQFKASPMNEYNIYLMFDVDAIDHDKRVSILKEDRDLYIPIFDEVSIDDVNSEEEILNAYPKAWKERNVIFPSGKVSLVSVVMNDPIGKILFIGHTGVLIEEQNQILFIEKLAPSEPYQVTRYPSRGELSDDLLSRADYQADSEAHAPILMENGELMQGVY